jgi:hypothetical protein
VLRNISILRGKTSVEVHIEASGPVKPVARVFPQPERIVVDLAGVGYDGSRRLPVNVGDVEGVRVALFQADPPVTRVVVDLARPHDYRLLPAGSMVIVTIDTRPKTAVAAQPPAAKLAAVAAVNTAPPAPSAGTSPAHYASEAKLQPPPVTQPEAPVRPPAESAHLPVTESSEPTVSTTLPQVATIAVSSSQAELPPSQAGEEETTPHQASKGSKPGVVRDITVSREKDAIEVHIEGTKPLRASTSTLSNPERIIIDLANVRLRRPRRIPVNAAGVEAVSVSLFLVNPLVTRVVVDLAHPHSYHLQATGNSLTVRIETDEIKTAGSQPAR